MLLNGRMTNVDIFGAQSEIFEKHVYPSCLDFRLVVARILTHRDRLKRYLHF